MATTNQPLDQWRDTLEKILQYYADLPYRYGDVRTYVVVSRDSEALLRSADRNHFMLIQEGWENERRIHGFVVHAEIRSGKIWIHYDGITGEMVAAGVPKDHIVLAFYPHSVREHTDYALA
ncbi:MAG: XisI protein [Rhizonema sp. PD38]|nr:XisI protein [Rhizonema sp. PD38]